MDSKWVTQLAFDYIRSLWHTLHTLHTLQYPEVRQNLIIIQYYTKPAANAFSMRQTHVPAAVRQA